jgi:hypothetical protein
VRRISGTICQITDLRTPTACASEPSGVGVSIDGTAIATTSTAGGAFELPLGDGIGNGVVYLAVGAASPTYHPSLVPVVVDGDGASGISLPVVTELIYGQLLTALDVVEPSGTGTIVLYLLDGPTPAQGATVIGPADASFAPRYDTANPQLWVTDLGTGTFGATLLFGVSESNAVSVEAVSAKAEGLTISPITVGTGSLTFVEAAF